MKQVFLIGDSIREGYCGKVKEALHATFSSRRRLSGASGRRP